ncbi:MAG: hypothetical protein JRM76_06315 [Nitrososphaerota archaeon]|nr:hypothetical protein [Nitrososphaerota archaeon]MDG6971145.1 hypothetical protein [Nitrososphaerota archaeon]MDG6972341.1 hypothetical protein [Nitrososphaerota archaeon]MDG6980077.1 hypothetical protein [Nitrososphaerota archaeon]MDG6986923.1 hypothetical protein [Nitrososphaerota archaeon]
MAESIPDAKDIVLWGRPELAAVSKGGGRGQYNEKVHGQAFFVNARARPSQGLLSPASEGGPFAMVSGGELVAAKLDSVWFRPGVIARSVAASIARKAKRVAPPPDPLFAGYWDMVAGNGLAIAEQARRFEEALPLPRAVATMGPASNLMVAEGAEVEVNVTLDGRLGPIVIESGASVESFSRVMGPCYLGPRVKLHSALIGGGTSIFEACKVGGEVENSIMLPYSNKAHHGYVGDAYVGSWVNLGAGCDFSNLKNTYGVVRPLVEGRKVDTGMVKLGPAIGDMAKVSIGSLVYAGRWVGTGSYVSGLIQEDVPSFTYYDGGAGRKVELELEAVLETQKRMMERRGLSLGRSEEALVRRAFASTSAERRSAGARKGKIAGQGLVPETAKH